MRMLLTASLRQVRFRELRSVLKSQIRDAADINEGSPRYVEKTVAFSKRQRTIALLRVLSTSVFTSSAGFSLPFSGMLIPLILSSSFLTDQHLLYDC
jgi:hypothetical protein